MGQKKKKQYQYDFDNRLDYIAYMFNVRTRRKAYENFIVNAIYARVGNLDLIPVTQQYVKSQNSDGQNKSKRSYYLLDLYFPQLNYGIEIDEGQHNNENNQEADKLRAEDIKAAIECVEERIPIYSNGKIQRPIEEIDRDINDIVARIKQMIDEKGGVIWKTNKQEIEDVKKNGRFTESDEADYNGITEICKIIGRGHPGQRCYVPLNKYYKLWVPKMAIKLSDGYVSNTANGYVNFLSEDHNYIYESKVNEKWILDEKTEDNKFLRVVFMQMKNRFGKRCVKFLGVYQQIETTCDQTTYYRVSKQIEIKELDSQFTYPDNTPPLPLPVAPGPS